MKDKSNSDNILISKAVRHLIGSVGLPLGQSAEALGMTPSEFMEWWSLEHQPLEYSHLHNLSQYLHIDDDSIVSGNLEYSLVRQRIFSSDLALPKRYQECAFSFTRSTAHIIKYLQVSRGQHFSDRIVQNLNVNPRLFESLDNKISILFFIDLMRILVAEPSVTKDEFDFLSSTIFLTLSETSLGHQFKEQSTYYDCYRVLVENLHLFDNNFIYTPQLNKNSFVFIARLNHERIGPLNLKPENIQHILQYKKRLIGWFPYLSNLAPLTVCERRCITRGDAWIEQVVEFPREERHLKLL